MAGACYQDSIGPTSSCSMALPGCSSRYAMKLKARLRRQSFSTGSRLRTRRRRKMLQWMDRLSTLCAGMPHSEVIWQQPVIDHLWRLMITTYEEAGLQACPSPKLDSSAFSTTSLVFLPTKIFEIKI